MPNIKRTNKTPPPELANIKRTNKTPPETAQYQTK